MRATQAIIHHENLIHNIQCVKNHILAAGKNPAICLPVKADAYGHGAVNIAKCALENGVTYLAVATVDEGVELRENGITAPILLFSQCVPCEMPDAARYNLTPLIADKEAAKLFDEAAQTHNDGRGAQYICAGGDGRPVLGAVGRGAVPPTTALNVFLKIDTGMGRMGCKPEDAADLSEYIRGLAGIKMAGVLTHLAVSDSANASDIDFTKRQLGKFERALQSIKEAGCECGLVSAANSGGVIEYPDSWGDLVRPGILMYGYAPKMHSVIPVRPVMELVSQIVAIKKVGAGTMGASFFHGFFKLDFL